MGNVLNMNTKLAMTKLARLSKELSGGNLNIKLLKQEYNSLEVHYLQMMGSSRGCVIKKVPLVLRGTFLLSNISCHEVI